MTETVDEIDVLRAKVDAADLGDPTSITKDVKALLRAILIDRRSQELSPRLQAALAKRISERTCQPESKLQFIIFNICWAFRDDRQLRKDIRKAGKQ